MEMNAQRITRKRGMQITNWVGVGFRDMRECKDKGTTMVWREKGGKKKMGRW